MWILIAHLEYVEVEFGDPNKDIDYSKGRQNLAWLNHFLGGPATHHQPALPSHAPLPSAVS